MIAGQNDPETRSDRDVETVWRFLERQTGDDFAGYKDAVFALGRLRERIKDLESKSPGNRVHERMRVDRS